MRLSKLTKNFLGGFFITLIALGALCGFALVDMRTDRYMPGTFQPLFQLTSLDGSGFSFSWMGMGYRVDTAPAAGVLDTAQSLSGLLPISAVLPGELTELACQAIGAYLDQRRETP